jgi:cell division septum initiation protein DivIVA
VSYYRTQQVRDLVSELVDDSLTSIAEQIIDLREKLEAAEEEVGTLESRVAELEAENG